MQSISHILFNAVFQEPEKASVTVLLLQKGS